MSHLVPLSVLDFAVIGAGQSETTALQQSVELAKHAEALGYQRFWTSEHHNMASVASTAPDLIAMRVADSTTRIKVGAGGVMLPNHAPLSVAERYLTLEAFHPDRVDLGVGRAPGTDGFTAHALRRADASHYAQHLAELDCFINGGFPANHPYAQILAAPKGSTRPKLFVLDQVWPVRILLRREDITSDLLGISRWISLLRPFEATENGSCPAPRRDPTPFWLLM